MAAHVILFLVVFLLNVIPAFAPPTWMVFSFLGFRLPEQMSWPLALVGAGAAASGRLLLGKFSRIVVRNHWLSETTRENINALKPQLEKRQKLTFSLFLLYAFSPLPSNYLFMAYGLTTLPLVRLLVPFFVGRFVSYSFWTMSAAAVSRKLDLERSDALAYLSVYFVLTQLALLALVYAFTRIDWALLFRERKWRWLPRSRTFSRSSPSRLLLDQVQNHHEK